MLNIALLSVIAPMSLACTIDNDGQKVAMTLWLDPAHGAVRYAWPATAPAVTARAIFTREQVLFDSFTLDRTSLAIVHDGDAITAALGAQPRVAEGRCRTAAGHGKPTVPAKATATPGNRRR